MTDQTADSQPHRPLTPTLDRVTSPADLRGMSDAELARVAEELRADIGPDAIYWDVADPDCPYGYNPLARVAVEKAR